MCNGSETGSYLRLIDFVYHSTLGLRVIKKKNFRLSARSENFRLSDRVVTARSASVSSRTIASCWSRFDASTWAAHAEKADEADTCVQKPTIRATTFCGRDAVLVTLRGTRHSVGHTHIQC